MKKSTTILLSLALGACGQPADGNPSAMTMPVYREAEPTISIYAAAAPDQGWPAIDVAALLAELRKGLRDGGIVGIIDHYAVDGAPPETGGTLHRIDPAIIVEEMTAAGFELDSQSDLLRNPVDDHEKSVFEPELRGRTDRFIMRFRKPE